MRALRSSGPAVVMLLLVLAVSPAMAAEQQSVPINWHVQSGSGPVGDGATATLVRRADGISFRLQTQNLRAGHAYTLWFVVVNNPEACTAYPCPAMQIIQNAATGGQVAYGAGHVAGNSGHGTFAGSFQAGAIPEGWLPGGGLYDPLGAEIHLVLNDHGPAIPGYLPGMIQTYRAGCTDGSLVPFFPASAKEDGAAGPNTCRLYQAAVFAPG